MNFIIFPIILAWGGQSNGQAVSNREEYECDASTTTAAAKGAGCKGNAGDCVARAIASGLPNNQVYRSGIAVKRSDSATTCARIRLSGLP
jgi:hypothetical protein